MTASLALLADAQASKPNLILIMADDLGYETLGCNGGESYATPHLDRMAAEGVRFANCYVQPVCTPTRVELMTGMSNVRNYIRFGIIDPEATTFAHLLKGAGYATGIAGKWQLGQEPDLPRRLGFDEACLWQHTRRPPRYANPGLEYDGVERDFRNGEYGPDLVSDFALDFIERHKDGPFFLYYPMTLVHAPYQPTPDSEEWDPTFDGNEQVKSVKNFADNVAYMDKLVGKLTAKVDELGLRENTVIFFLGDNGTGRGVTTKFAGGEYHGGKGLTNARGMHVPLIVNQPGGAAAGRTCERMVASVDFLPTLCEFAGVDLPAEPALDGRSFKSHVDGVDGAAREPLHFWYSSQGAQASKVEFALSDKYKLYRGGRFFDLTADPYEDGPPLREAELTGEMAVAAKELRAVLDRFEGRGLRSCGTPRRRSAPAAIEPPVAPAGAGRAPRPHNRPASKRRQAACRRQASRLSVIMDIALTSASGPGDSPCKCSSPPITMSTAAKVLSGTSSRSSAIRSSDSAPGSRGSTCMWATPTAASPAASGVRWKRSSRGCSRWR